MYIIDKQGDSYTWPHTQTPPNPLPNSSQTPPMPLPHQDASRSEPLLVIYLPLFARILPSENIGGRRCGPAYWNRNGFETNPDSIPFHRTRRTAVPVPRSQPRPQLGTRVVLLGDRRSGGRPCISRARTLLLLGNTSTRGSVLVSHYGI